MEKTLTFSRRAVDQFPFYLFSAPHLKGKDLTVLVDLLGECFATPDMKTQAVLYGVRVFPITFVGRLNFFWSPAFLDLSFRQEFMDYMEEAECSKLKYGVVTFELDCAYHGVPEVDSDISCFYNGEDKWKLLKMMTPSTYVKDVLLLNGGSRWPL